MQVVGFPSRPLAATFAHMQRVSSGPRGTRLCRGPNVGDRISLGGGAIDGCRRWLPSWLVCKLQCLLPRRHPSPLVAKMATRDDSIVSDPAEPGQDGLFASLNRPGGNLIGVACHLRTGIEATGALARTSSNTATIAVF